MLIDMITSFDHGFNPDESKCFMWEYQQIIFNARGRSDESIVRLQIKRIY